MRFHSITVGGLFLLSSLHGSASGLAADYNGSWNSASGTAVFYDDNRGPIAYEQCTLRLDVQQTNDRLTIAFLGVDCSITDDLPFSHEAIGIGLEIRGDALYGDGGQKVGTITEKLISFDHADNSDGMHYFDVDREASGALTVNWAYRNNLFPGFDVQGSVFRKPE
ncbi:MAG: hypothetical protein A2X94_15860 [Bdellovibrionales bacterium GWB1_55_8]|nr:MAG: hypothetical protein A2X94_15860 [Bdellovibrionales bacterium GWB1_55_8]